MNYKKKIFISSIFFILIIQILLFINNKQKTSFRYFIWTVEEVSIGRLICISFVSGLLVSSLLNKTVHNEIKTYQIYEDNDNRTSKNNFSLDDEDTNDSNEIPPERDIRDTQPTISVNYRVIKDNGENEFKDRKKTSKKTQYEDDWNNSDSEW